MPEQLRGMELYDRTDLQQSFVRAEAGGTVREASLIITGNGDVLEPEHGIIAIGSGGAYAHAAARALVANTDLSAQAMVKKSLEIAGDLCIYTNQNHVLESLAWDVAKQG